MAKNDIVGFTITRDGIDYNTHKPKIVYSPKEKQIFNNTMKFDSLMSLISPDGNKLIAKYDSNESLFLRDQLSVIIKNVIDTWYPDFNARNMFPVNNLGTPGATTVKYIEKDFTGRARIAGSKTTGMPLIGASRNPVYSPVYHSEVGAMYDYYELQSALLSNTPLQSEYLEATKKAQENAFNDIAFGIGKHEDEQQIPGLFNQLDKMITNDKLATRPELVDNLIDVNLLTCTAKEFYDFLCTIADVPHTYWNNNSAITDTVALPIAQANRGKNLVYDTVTKESVFTVFLKNNPNIKKILAVHELASNRNTDDLIKHDDVCIAYRMSPEILEVVTTQNYTILPTYTEGATRFIIPTTQGFGGLLIYKSAIAYVANCGTP